MLKMIFFDEDPDEVFNEEDIRGAGGTSSRGEVERIDFRDTEEVNIDLLDSRNLLDCRNMLIYGFLKMNACQGKH